MEEKDIFWNTGHVENVMNSHEIHSVHDDRGRREEGQDYVEDEDDVVGKMMDTRRGQDYINEEDDDGSGILNKVMDTEEVFDSES